MTSPETISSANQLDDRRPASRRRRLTVLAVLLALLAVIGVGCGSSGESISSDTTGASDTDGASEPDDGCVAAENDAIEIVTTKFDFDPECISTSGDRLQVTYDNQEEGVSHNIHFKDASSSTGEARTELKDGPDVQTLTLVDLESGSYTYICDIHASMKGELVVE